MFHSLFTAPRAHTIRASGQNGDVACVVVKSFVCFQANLIQVEFQFSHIELYQCLYCVLNSVSYAVNYCDSNSVRYTWVEIC